MLLAIYVSVGRMLSSLSGAYQNEILQELNYRVPFIIDAERVSAEWHSFTRGTRNPIITALLYL